MALIKQVKDRGVTGEYWHISGLSYNKDKDRTLAKLRCYIDKATRDNDINDYIAMPEFQKSVWVDGLVTMDQAYEALKNQQTTTTGSNEEEQIINGFFYGAVDA